MSKFDIFCDMNKKSTTENIKQPWFASPISLPPQFPRDTSNTSNNSNFFFQPPLNNQVLLEQLIKELIEKDLIEKLDNPMLDKYKNASTIKEKSKVLTEKIIKQLNDRNIVYDMILKINLFPFNEKKEPIWNFVVDLSDTDEEYGWKIGIFKK